MKTVITSSDRSFLNLGELKRYAGLFKYLSLRDVFVRYKTNMGRFWLVHYTPRYQYPYFWLPFLPGGQVAELHPALCSGFGRNCFLAAHLHNHFRCE